MQSELDVDSMVALARSQFPYFTEDPGTHPAFMENAGGSQVPRCVIDSIAHYMAHSYAQLGAGHAVARRADATVSRARDVMLTLLNGHGCGQVALGPSASRLLETLARCYALTLKPGDEVIVQESAHESNVGPWVRAAEAAGCKLRMWSLDTERLTCRVEDLYALLSPATRIVAVTHVSNLLGEVLDLPQVVQAVRRHAPSARVVVDGVAYAPHRAMDVSGWGVDYYVLSNYKLLGPHMATMYVSDAAASDLVSQGGTAKGPNHYFVPQGNLVYALELGGISHEGCAGILGLQPYLRLLATGAAAAEQQPPLSRLAPSHLKPEEPLITRAEVEAAYRTMETLEAGPQRLLLDFLATQPEVTILGPRQCGGGGGDVSGTGGHSDGDSTGGAAASASGSTSCSLRVPTVSFVHSRLQPSAIASAVNAAGFAIRHGHMYARRLVERLVAAGVIGKATKGHVALAGVSVGVDEGTAEGVAASTTAATAAAAATADAAAAADAAVEEGVVRVSLLHYNTEEEVGRLVGVLRRLFRDEGGLGGKGALALGG